MILSVTDPTIYTRVFYRDRYVLVGMSEEELFRSVMGNTKFELEVRAAWNKDEESRNTPPAAIKPRFKLFR